MAKRARRCTRRRDTRRGSRRGQINETHASSGSQARKTPRRKRSSSISDASYLKMKELLSSKFSTLSFAKKCFKTYLKRMTTLALGREFRRYCTIELSFLRRRYLSLSENAILLNFEKIITQNILYVS